MKKEQKENIENFEKEFEQKKKIPKSIREKINAKRFENVVIAAIIMIYFAALNIGMGNIPTDTYIMDLKVFSIILLTATIFIFEYGYKKDDVSIWIHGIEVMVVAIFTLYLIYLYSIYYSTYGDLLISISALYLIYYVIKILITKIKIKKNYNKSFIDIEKIVKQK